MLFLSVSVLIASIAYSQWRTFRDVYTPEQIQEKYGPYAVVLGASEGLGAVWAETLCANGLSVISVARRKDELEAKAQELRTHHNCTVEPVVMNLIAEDVYEQFQNLFQSFDVGLMVYNAALYSPGSFLDLELDSHVQLSKLNMESTVKAVHAYARRVRDTGKNSSGLILMGSTLGEQGSGYVSSYSASKAWANVFAQSLAAEFRPTIAMDVLACVAGPIHTPNFWRYNSKEAIENDPMMRMMMLQPQEVADECLHALGGPAYSIATGALQKVFRFMANRVLPSRVMVDSFTENMQTNMVN